MKEATKNTKRMLCAGLAVWMTVGTGMSAMAGTWRQGAGADENRWWYDFDNGSYATGWQWIDGNQDGTAESYYFDQSGWMLAGTTTPDGYMVNADGAWVENGQVQTKAAEVQQPEGTGEQGSQSQPVQGTRQYVSGSYGADGTWTDISEQQQYDDFNSWINALMAAPDNENTTVRTLGAIEYWASISERGAAWKAAFDRYGVSPDVYREKFTSGSEGTVTFTTPAGIESEARHDVESALGMMLWILTDGMGYMPSCNSTVNGDGTITVTLSYKMGG